jgi:cell division transport system permease protein
MNRRVNAPATGQRFVVPRPALRALVDQHLYSALSSLGRLWQRRGGSAITMLVMALALALPLLLQLAVGNFAILGGTLRDARELTVFADAGIATTRVETLRAQALALPGVADARARSPAQNLEDLRRLAGFGEALDLIDRNPLPATLVVAPQDALDAAAIATLARALEAIEDVDFVQYDLGWRERLDAALALSRRAVLLVATLLALGALLVVGNTIRLDVAARADEIAVMQLLGATDGFVRRPFLYAGVWYGAAAALLAVLGVALAGLALGAPVARLAGSYGSAFRLIGVGAGLACATVAAGIMLGWLGAWAACGRHLARGKPQ